MKILIIDQDKVGLPFAMKAKEAGHTVKLWMTFEKNGKRSRIGEGIVDLVSSWETWMRWADLIVLTENAKLRGPLTRYFKQGYPIFGCNKEAAELELDRGVGQEVFKQAGCKILPYETFNSYSKAIQYVRETGKAYVSKPWGGDADKSLSYVPPDARSLMFKLEKWKSEGHLKGELMLQQKVEGVEMAVGGWFGPGGWSKWWNENWEEKRLMNDGKGPNTGEMGTVMRYTKKSQLAEEVLLPITTVLHQLNYVGYCDVNCMIDKKGTPYPLEFTMRFGWPHFNLCMTLHQGDPAKWMVDLLEGRDTLSCSTDVCVGVVRAHGDFPFGNLPLEEVSGYPIMGITPAMEKNLRLTSVRMGQAPIGKGFKQIPVYVTEGEYILVVTGTGKTVEDARKDAYSQMDKIQIPSDPTYRTDIGCRMEGDLNTLHKLGYAKGMEYGKS